MSTTPPPAIEDNGRDTALCALAEIPDPGGRGFRIGAREAMFVIRRGADVFGYVNICPHAGLPLDWKPDVFLCFDKRHIQCANHGARFDIATGSCVAGPLPGGRLRPVRLRIENGMVMLYE